MLLLLILERELTVDDCGLYILRCCLGSSRHSTTLRVGSAAFERSKSTIA